MKRRAILITTIFALTLSASNLVANAQTQNTFKTAKGLPTPKPDRSKWQSKSNPNLDAQPMKEKIALPNLPEFTGHAKFTGGVSHQGQYGNSYVMRFDIKEDPKIVADWYKNTLNMYKWKINFSDDTTVMAKLNGATCAVVVNNVTAGKTPVRSELEINYFQSK